MNTTPPPLTDLFADAFARYLAVRPTGLQMPHGPIVPTLRARLLACRPARTLYENHQPRCRSLDGIQSITEARTCAACLLRKTCTPQIYLQLLHDRVPYRLLLAYTSARNFMLFASYSWSQSRGTNPGQGEWGDSGGSSDTIGVFMDAAPSDPPDSPWYPLGTVYDDRGWYGYLPDDIRNHIKINGLYRAPWAIDIGLSFEWSDVSDESLPVTYELQVADKPDFSTGAIILKKEQLSRSAYTATSEDMEKLEVSKTPYYWRVRATDSASNLGEWASPSTFMVAAAFPGWALYTLIALGVIILVALGFLLNMKLSRSRGP